MQCQYRLGTITCRRLIMTDTLWWMLLALAVLLLAANAVLPDVWTAWLHERFDSLLHRIRQH
jgi:hypothetical protein